MKRIIQRIVINNRTVDKKPAGGTYTVHTPQGQACLVIEWQNGPLVAEDGSVLEYNGLFLETLLRAGRERLRYYQSTPFRSAENALAEEHLDASLHHLELALEALDARARRREEAGTLGTHQLDSADNLT